MNVNFKSHFLVFEKNIYLEERFCDFESCSTEIIAILPILPLNVKHIYFFCNKCQTSSKTSFDKQQQKQPQKVQSSMKILRIHILHT